MKGHVASSPLHSLPSQPALPGQDETAAKIRNLGSEEGGIPEGEGLHKNSFHGRLGGTVLPFPELKEATLSGSYSWPSLCPTFRDGS